MSNLAYAEKMDGLNISALGLDLIKRMRMELISFEVTAFAWSFTVSLYIDQGLF